jgi:hypothetical protein
MIDEYPAATVTVRAELFVTGDDMITNLIEKNGLPPPAYLEDYELTLVNYDELMILIIIKYRSGTPEIVPEQYSILKSVQESINFGKEPR